MSNTLLGFGLFALVAATVGGGLKAFGFEIGVLNSKLRQIILAAVGIALICSAKWGLIQPLLFPMKLATETIGPILLAPGDTYTFPLFLNRPGPVDVLIQSLDPNWNGFSGQRGMAGQDALFVTICGSGSETPCPRRQMGLSQAFRHQLPVGAGTVSVFNFATSPKMRFTLSVKHPA